MPDTTPKLPRNAANGTEVADVYGNIWKFHAPSKTWIINGVIPTVSDVTEEEDGLVYPSLYAKLEVLKEAASQSDFGLFKIYPAINSYWYRFLSHNKTIRFNVENQDTVRIEVDRARLIQALSYHKCFGPQGIKGKKGPSGRDGISGKHETVYTPHIVDNLLMIDASVVVEIDTPISLRIYKDGQLVVNVYVGLDGTNEIRTNTLSLDLSSVTYSDNKIVGSIPLTAIDGEWAYRVGQVGATGEKGDDGHPFFSIDNVEVDSRFISPAVLTLIRQGAGDNLYSSITNVPTVSCVGKLSFKPSPCADINSLGNSAVLAVVPGTQTCKDISLFRFHAIDSSTNLSHAVSLAKPNLLDKPALELPDWTPTETCWRQRHWQVSKFNWPDLTHVPAEQLLWPEPNTDDIRSPAYPFAIKQASAPGERCCQDDFFYCANVNDKNYPIRGADGGIAQILPPPQPPLCCECDCPIELELQGGYDFVDYIVSSDGVITHCGTGGVDETGCQTAVCVINGQLHTYRQRIIIYPQDSETDSEISIKVGYDTLCNDANNMPRPSGDIPPFYLGCPEPKEKADCPFFWTAEVVSPVRGDFVQDGVLFKSSSGNKTIKFKFNATQGGIVDVVISINTTLQNCCLGYYVTTCAVAYKSTVASAGLSPSPSPSGPAGVSPSPPPPSIFPSGSTPPPASPSVFLSPSLSPSPSPFVPHSPPPPVFGQTVVLAWWSSSALDYVDPALYYADKTEFENLVATLSDIGTEGIKVKVIAHNVRYPSTRGTAFTPSWYYQVSRWASWNNEFTTPIHTGGSSIQIPTFTVHPWLDDSLLPLGTASYPQDSFGPCSLHDSIVDDLWPDSDGFEQRRFCDYSVYPSVQHTVCWLAAPENHPEQNQRVHKISPESIYNDIDGLSSPPSVIFISRPEDATPRRIPAPFDMHEAGHYIGFKIGETGAPPGHEPAALTCPSFAGTYVYSGDSYCMARSKYWLGSDFRNLNEVASAYPDSEIVTVTKPEFPLRWIAHMTKTLKDYFGI